MAKTAFGKQIRIQPRGTTVRRPHIISVVPVHIYYDEPGCSAEYRARDRHAPSTDTLRATSRNKESTALLLFVDTLLRTCAS